MISDWRRALKSHLQTAYPEADVLAGRRTGISRDKVRIALFFDGYERQADRAVVANPVFVIRFWPDRSKLPEDTPEDPTQLEQAAMDLARFLEPLQTTMNVTDLWYFLVDSIRIDEDPAEWGVEVRLRGFAKNIATSFA